MLLANLSREVAERHRLAVQLPLDLKAWIGGVL
jgi:hypothetical protein